MYCQIILAIIRSNKQFKCLNTNVTIVLQFTISNVKITQPDKQNLQIRGDVYVMSLLVLLAMMWRHKTVQKQNTTFCLTHSNELHSWELIPWNSEAVDDFAHLTLI